MATIRNLVGEEILALDARLTELEKRIPAIDSVELAAEAGRDLAAIRRDAGRLRSVGPEEWVISNSACVTPKKGSAS